MAGSKKGERRGGRKKGTPNVRSWDISRRLSELGFDPAAKLVALTLEAEAQYKIAARRMDDAAPSYLATASANCAKLMKFVYPERKAVDVTSAGEPVKALSFSDFVRDVIAEENAKDKDES